MSEAGYVTFQTCVHHWQTVRNLFRHINQQIQDLKRISVNAKKTNYSTSLFAAETSPSAILNLFRQQWGFFDGFHGYWSEFVFLAASARSDFGLLIYSAETYIVFMLNVV